MDDYHKTPFFLATSAHSQPEVEICLSIVGIPEYAARYDVTRKTIHKWMVRGMPHLKISTRCTRIPIAEADRWVQQTFFRQRAK